jgi:tetratricopeptide (TPR) repeat protein
MNRTLRRLKRRIRNSWNLAVWDVAFVFYLALRPVRRTLRFLADWPARPAPGAGGPMNKTWRRLKRRIRNVWNLVVWDIDFAFYLTFRPARRAVRYLADWGQTRNFWHLLAGLPALAAGAGAVYLMSQVWITPASALVTSYRQEAAQRFQAKDLEGALVCCERLVMLDPGRPDSAYDLAVKLAALGHKERSAVLLADLAPGERQGYAPAHVGRAQALLAGANPPPQALRDAEAHLLRALQRQPDNAAAHALLGRLYAATGQLNRAEGHLIQGLKILPELRLTLARLYATQGKAGPSRVEAKLALDYFRRLAEADVDNAAARTQWAAAAVILEDYAGAAEILRWGLALPRADVYRGALAELYAVWSDAAGKDAGGGDDRLALLEQGLGFDPENPRLLQRLFVLTRLNGDEAEQARAALRRSLARGKAAATVHMLLGADAAARGQTEEARRHCEQAYKLAPHLTGAANNLAWMLAHADPPDLPQALTLVNGVLEREPRNASFLDTRGHVLAKMGRYQEALADLETVLRERPDNAELHRILAECYRHLGQPELAAEHQRLAAAKAP